MPALKTRRYRHLCSRDVLVSAMKTNELSWNDCTSDLFELSKTNCGEFSQCSACKSNQDKICLFFFLAYDVDIYVSAVLPVIQRHLSRYSMKTLSLEPWYRTGILSRQKLRQIDSLSVILHGNRVSVRLYESLLSSTKMPNVYKL